MEKIDLAGGEGGVQEMAGRAVFLGCEGVFSMTKVDEECNSQENKEKDKIEASPLLIYHLSLIRYKDTERWLKCQIGH
ncbi:MAG: hypothetical protein KAT01_02385 [Candidatus Aminicenantes bacterium]|nr:hypothetical protein [Candidatus Aminicenantes bacterium]